MACITLDERLTTELPLTVHPKSILRLIKLRIILDEESDDGCLTFLGHHHGDLGGVLLNALINAITLTVEANIGKRVLLFHSHVDVVFADDYVRGSQVCGVGISIEALKVGRNNILLMNIMDSLGNFRLEAFFSHEGIKLSAVEPVDDLLSFG